MQKKRDHTSSFSSILKGEFIAHRNNQKYAPFLLMLVALILINISVSFRAEELLKESISLEKEVADLRLIHITTRSELMSMYRRSIIEELVRHTGIQTSLTPPIIIDKVNE